MKHPTWSPGQACPHCGAERTIKLNGGNAICAPPDGCGTFVDEEIPGQPFIVRYYDGFDNEWMDVFGPATSEAAANVLDRLTEGGTKNRNYADIDYFKVFAADTVMVNSEEGNRDLGVQTIRDAPEPEPERLPSRAEHKVGPWGHKVHVSIYYKGDATDREIQGIIEGINEIAPDAEFIGVEIHTVQDEPQDQGAT